ncbi:hypothetical protein [uncultured Sunxiuqinia sp.]|uniref:hypothetical protein n=1 Tax=uncultured Sunxiuqinia sp. TaxID=1573825 RepID=UPI002AA80B32|nr:hypothetical protein [uncultured Sunxiuqinia sp.]
MHKSKGIGVRLTAILSSEKATYSLDDLKAIEETYRTQYPEDNKLVAWFFLLPMPMIKKIRKCLAWPTVQAP